jgi:four helix bundle protein
MLNEDWNGMSTKSGQDDFTVKEPHEFYNEKRDFTTLDAWIKCREVKLFFYKKVLPSLPKEEKYNLDLQIRKASISITANISEGYGRYHYQEGIQFYRISRGSIYELKDHLLSCYDIGYIGNDLKVEGERLIESAKVTLNGFINFVKNKIK